MSIAVYSTHQAKEFIRSTQAIMHPQASAELEKNITIFRAWLIERVEELMECHQRFVELSPSINDWNEGGYGLQSVGIKAFSPNSTLSDRQLQKRAKMLEGLLLSHQYRASTVGVSARGMLSKGRKNRGEMEFEIEPEKAEQILNLSEENDLMIRAVAKGTNKTLPGTPDVLPPGGRLIVEGSEAAVRLAMQTTHKVRKRMAGVMNGAYICDFIYTSLNEGSFKDQKPKPLVSPGFAEELIEAGGGIICRGDLSKETRVGDKVKLVVSTTQEEIPVVVVGFANELNIADVRISVIE